jgi:hypothetical protein
VHFSCFLHPAMKNLDHRIISCVRKYICKDKCLQVALLNQGFYAFIAGCTDAYLQSQWVRKQRQEDCEFEATLGKVIKTLSQKQNNGLDMMVHAAILATQEAGTGKPAQVRPHLNK